MQKAAKAIGLRDSSHGLIFFKDPITTLKEEEDWVKSCGETRDEDKNRSTKSNYFISPSHRSGNELVTESEKDLIADYLYLTMQQMEKTYLNESDRIGCCK